MRYNLICFFFLISLLNCSQFKKDSITADKGKFNLIESKIQSESISIEGEWEFYWNQLIDERQANQIKGKIYVKSGQNWMSNGYEGTGIASYRMKIFFPESELGRMYGLKIGHGGGGAQKIFVDGKLYLELGKVSTSKETMTPTRMPGYIEFPIDKSEISIIFQFSNFHYYDGGFWYSPTIGRKEIILKEIFQKNLIDAFFLGTVFIISIYHFVIFFFTKKIKSYLYFGLFAFTIFFHGLSLNGEILFILFPDISYFITYLINFSFVLAMPFFLLFLNYEIENEFSLMVLKILTIISFVNFISYIVFPFLLSSYLTLPAIFYGLSLIFYTIFKLIKASLKKKNFAFLYLSPLVLLFFSAVFDFLTIYAYLNFFLTLKYTYFIFVLVQSFLLSKKFSNSFLTIKNLSEKLTDYNKNLEKSILIRTEELMVQKEIAEEENMWKDKFIVLVSHDLKSPINAVIRYIEHLMDNKSNSTNEINPIIEKSRKILLNSISSINHLLSLNRFQNNKSKVNYKDIDLYEIINNLQDEFNIVLEEKKQTIDNQISENTILTTDENIIKEILRNLIMNAIKFSYEGKSISLKYEESEYLHLISVIDTGVGFAEFQSKTLDDSSIKIKSRMGTNGEIGYGLGLNLCNELIQLLDGSIQIQSSLNQGSSVILSLPINTNVLLLFTSNMELIKLKMEFRKFTILPIFSSSLSEFSSLTNDIFYKMIIIDLNTQPNLSNEFFEKIYFDFGKSAKPIVLLDLENKYQEDIVFLQNKFDSLKFVVWQAHDVKREDIAFYCNELLLNL